VSEGHTLHDPHAARHAGRDWLSLALIDARNRTLRWLAAFEGATVGPRQGAAGLPSALWLAGHAAWWADWWIVRHVTAQRGEDADPDRPRLAPADEMSDSHFRDLSDGAGLPTPDAVRAWMADTLEATLELLAATGDDDRSLYIYRQVLRHEDRTLEHLAALAQALDLADAPWPAAAHPAADPGPLWMPAQRWQLGSPPGGLVPGPERWAHGVALPEFEIDARPVSWARWLEFAQDGGYDEPRWWTTDGWAWLQAQQRRAPRYVEQQRQAVVHQHQGRLARAPAQAPAAHVTRHEAAAWCAWAGRRLPAEPEWELAAATAAPRGFSWGQVLEWVAGSGRGWPGHADPPAELDPLPPAGTGFGVLRGASRWAPPRIAHPKARRFAAPEDDVLPVGFRSCAL
jgi:gamma-glutamyl hercynylcysteine S-oxide synthase